MGRVKMLLHFGVTPYLVFDGDYLPSKAAEESGRAAYVKFRTFIASLTDWVLVTLVGERQAKKQDSNSCVKGKAARHMLNFRKQSM